MEGKEKMIKNCYTTDFGGRMSCRGYWAAKKV